MNNKTSLKIQIIIPLIRAAIFGFFVFLLVKTLFRDEPELALYGTPAGVLIAMISFYLLSATYHDRGQGKTTTTEKEYRETVRINLVDERDPPYTRGTYVTARVPRNKLILLAKSLEAGHHFSHASFAGRGKLFSRPEYEQLRDEFIERGLIDWKNPDAHAQGLELTRGGRSFTRHFSRMDLTPPNFPVWRKQRSPFDAHAHASAHDTIRIKGFGSRS